MTEPVPTATDPLTERIRAAKALDLFLLPFEPGLATADHYEEALIAFYKRRWRFTRIRFVHYFLVVPALLQPFRALPARLTPGTLLRRLLPLLLILGGIAKALHWGMNTAGYEDRFPFVIITAVLCLFTMYCWIGLDAFHLWRDAYQKIDPATLAAHYPKKRKRRKPTQAPLPEKEAASPPPPSTEPTKNPVA